MKKIETMRIEITGMKVSEMNKLGDMIVGDWHIESIADKNDKTKDRVWIIRDDRTIRAENVRQVI